MTTLPPENAAAVQPSMFTEAHKTRAVRILVNYIGLKVADYLVSGDKSMFTFQSLMKSILNASTPEVISGVLKPESDSITQFIEEAGGYGALSVLFDKIVSKSVGVKSVIGDTGAGLASNFIMDKFIVSML